MAVSVADPELRLCFPGEKLFPDDDNYQSGSGTYVRQRMIISTLAGVLHLVDNEGQRTVEVRCQDANRFSVPFVGAIVTCKITAINPRFCKLEITSVADCVLSNSFSGQIRKEDVREKDKDRVEMQKCYRPDDTIVARVTSLGDSQSFWLCTAENELGVVGGVCEEGHAMKFIESNVTEMHCSSCKTNEPRKIAILPA